MDSLQNYQRVKEQWEWIFQRDYLGFDHKELMMVKNLGIKRTHGGHYVLGHLKGKEIEYEPY